jgi:hypothetical protein
MEMIGYYSDLPNSQQVPTGFSQLFPAAVDSITSGGNQGVWLFTVGNTNSSALSLAFDTIARHYVPQVKSLVMNVPGNGQIAQDLRRSDHAPFWDAGFKALMLTDGADFRNVNYHTPGDQIGTINFSFLVRNIQAITAVTAELAKPISAGTESKGAWQLLKNVPFLLKENEQNLSIEVYPNPVSKDLYLKFDDDFSTIEIQLVDAVGKIIFSKQINHIVKGNVIKIPIDKISAGVYLLNGNAKGITFHKTIVVTEGHYD